MLDLLYGTLGFVVAYRGELLNAWRIWRLSGVWEASRS